MAKQSYLIMHDELIGATLHYFQLQEGVLRYYRSSDPEDMSNPIGEFILYGSKVQIKAQRRENGFPYSFHIEAQKVHTKDRSYTLGPKLTIELTASCAEQRQDWGSTICTWNRFFWRGLPDPHGRETKLEDDFEKKILFQLMERYGGSQRSRLRYKSISFHEKKILHNKSIDPKSKLPYLSHGFIPNRKRLSSIGNKLVKSKSTVAN